MSVTDTIFVRWELAVVQLFSLNPIWFLLINFLLDINFNNLLNIILLKKFYELPKIHELLCLSIWSIYVPVMILDLTIPFLTSGLDLKGSFQTGWLSLIEGGSHQLHQLKYLEKCFQQ
jgi:hypothetical protein